MTAHHEALDFWTAGLISLLIIPAALVIVVVVLLIDGYLKRRKRG